MATPRFPLMAMLVAAALALGACGGGSSTTATDDDRGPAPPDEPLPAGLSGILERANTLLLIGEYARWSLTAGDEMIAGTIARTAICAAARCVAADGAATTVQALAGVFTGPATGGGEATLGMRGGFETVATASSFEITGGFPDATVTAAPAETSYGFWGEHGFAAVTLSAGALSAVIEGDAFSGDFEQARAWAAGDATGTNPEGVGGATWTGIAEAVGTGDFTRLEGSATVRIADLSRPRVGVAIDVPGHAIGAPGWDDMPLRAGRFTAGTPGGGDWLAGDFHGLDHAEAWGVFDTTDYIGAFGARREP